MLKDNMKEIEKKIGELFRLLRFDLMSNNYSVVLLLIYLKSKNYLTKILNDKNPKESLLEYLKITDDSKLSKVYDIYLPTIKILSEQTINRLLEILDSIDQNILQENIVEMRRKST